MTIRDLVNKLTNNSFKERQARYSTIVEYGIIKVSFKTDTKSVEDEVEGYIRVYGYYDDKVGVRTPFDIKDSLAYDWQDEGYRTIDDNLTIPWHCVKSIEYIKGGEKKISIIAPSGLKHEESVIEEEIKC